MIRAVVNVDASRQKVFSVLTAFAHYTKWVPGCERCEVVAANGRITDVQIVMRSTKRMELGLRFEAEPVQSLKFWMTKGDDIKRYSGTYRLMDSADQKGTVLITELEIDAGFMAPQFMVDRMTSKALRDNGEALQKFVRTLAAAGESEAPAGLQAGGARSRRNKRVVRVVKTPSGYRVLLFGETFTIESKGN